MRVPGVPASAGELSRDAHRLEDIGEPLRLLTGREVEIDEHVAVVVHGVLHPLVARATLPAAVPSQGSGVP